MYYNEQGTYKLSGFSYRCKLQLQVQTSAAGANFSSRYRSQKLVCCVTCTDFT